MGSAQPVSKTTYFGNIETGHLSQYVFTEGRVSFLLLHGKEVAMHVFS